MRVVFIFLFILLLDVIFMNVMHNNMPSGLNLTINFLTGFIGLVFVKRGIAGHVVEIYKKLRAKKKIVGDSLNALVLFMAGLLLLIPGIVTDILGILLVVPIIRDKVINYLFRK